MSYHLSWLFRGATTPARLRSTRSRQYGIFHLSTAGCPALIASSRSGLSAPTSPSGRSGRRTSARDRVVF